jgi:hypothetical protein
MIRRSASALTLVSLVTLVACTEAPPYMRISDADDWSATGGTTSVVAPGTAAFPQAVTLRIEARRSDEGYDVNDPLASAALAVIDGSACRVAVPLSCTGGICFATLELSGPGLCQVRASGVTRDGIALDDCWYRGTWEADIADTAFALQVHEAAEAAHASCLASSE